MFGHFFGFSQQSYTDPNESDAKMPVVLKKAILVLLGNRSISTQLKLLNALDSVD